MNINLNKNNNMMMRSTALTIFLLHILYISLVRGFIPSSSSSFHHRHVSYARIQATRQDDMIATVSKTTRAYTSSSSRVMKPAPSSRSLPLRPHSNTNNSNNQYTQFFKDNVLVGIQRTSPNSRRISGEMIMNIPIDRRGLRRNHSGDKRQEKAHHIRHGDDNIILNFLDLTTIQTYAQSIQANVLFCSFRLISSLLLVFFLQIAPIIFLDFFATHSVSLVIFFNTS